MAGQPTTSDRLKTHGFARRIVGIESERLETGIGLSEAPARERLVIAAMLRT